MKEEHCDRDNCHQEFTTNYYKLTTCPVREWKLVHRELVPSDEEMKANRVLPDIDQLMHSDLALKAGLSLFEIIVIVLYTGCMVS